MASLKAEAWVWYGIVITLVVLRYVARFLHLRSIKRFQVEDYLMVFVAICYTLLIIFLNIEATLPSNLVPPDQVNQIQPNSIPQRIYGSKMAIVVEQFWCVTVWSCKICLLFLYSQLTAASRNAILVKVVAGYVVLGYCVMEILFFAVWCRPFYNYWSVPATNPQCSTYQDHLIVNTVLNVSSDVMMLCIPLPILMKAKLPLQKKLILGVVFSMGIFVIICAVLSKAYSFGSPYGVDWVYWYVREVSTAVIVANLPHLWVLVRLAFNLRSFLSNGGSGSRSRGGTNTDPGSVLQSGKNHATDGRHWYPLKDKASNVNSFTTGFGSEENITSVPLEIQSDNHFGNDLERASPDLEDALGHGNMETLKPPGLHTGWQSKSTFTSTDSEIPAKC